MRTNDIILKTTSAIIVFVILAFSVNLFLAGHNAPGGGFIGGLMASGGFLLLYIAFGLKTMSKILKVNFRYFIAAGLMIAFLTGAGSFLFGQPFLSHTYGYFNLPILGKTELATAMLFDLGVYITVIGVTMTILLEIAQDRG
ncbi:Na(+)/H(+) antiporter subunit B [Alkalihalobacillus sp. AL-G]|uniref:Na(+)/H(+) antiporter subunit B n=1 Tax=Alkalihalobacillus sp. AL-G TaxID=2926399 RepID=UPI00272A0E18|nr:Na(+)/H(+) antiporter subunit B [Alkalihalobacillus sp. AL-G]WLD95260.1 Na(+)/H(+) antiporter subunit B [Alkalihalobacillus sp. AL-G]